MSEVTIRAEQPADREAVFEVHAAAFGRTDEAELVDALRHEAHKQISLVAERGGRVIGHVFFSPVQVGEGTQIREVAGLAPVGVLPELQDLGAGSALVRAGLEQCPTRDWNAVFLIGNPAYYARFGFELAAPLGFHYQSNAFDPVLQVALLSDDVLDGLTGNVVYHPAFDAL